MSLLNEIAETSRKRVQKQKLVFPHKSLKDLVKPSTVPNKFLSLFESEEQVTIAEIKFASPSKGKLTSPGRLLEISDDYTQAGVKAISILTEPSYFQGDIEYLGAVHRRHPNTSLLMKDFVVGTYQIDLARYFGASSYLLIAALLSKSQLQEFIDYGRALGLEPLVEVHSQEELDMVHQTDAKIIGVNNRDLHSLKVDLKTSFDLAPSMQEDRFYVSESGIQSREEVESLKKVGYKGFLIGTYFMQKSQPSQGFKAVSA
jgi:indole-3-glycerol phosphate synthase